MFNRKSMSPVLSAVILAAAIIAVGVIVLMWISGHSSMVIKQSQIDLLRSEQAAKENLVIVHVTYNASQNKVIMYLLNMGYNKIFLGPIRIKELRSTDYEDIFTPEGIWFGKYEAKVVVDSTESYASFLTMNIGGLSEYLENLEIRDPSAITDEINAYILEPYNEINGYYKVEISATLNTNSTYNIEVWTIVNIYNKAYLCKLYAAQLTT